MRYALIVLLVIFWCGPVIAEDYIIGDGDVLQVSVWGVPEMSVNVKVRPDGKITLPASGDVIASGRTPQQLGGQITKLIGRFVKEPVVTLTVVEVTNNKVYVAGGGVASRVVTLSERSTLFRFLCNLENMENADLSEAYVLRGGKKIFSNFHSLLVNGDMSRDIALAPDDIVFIPNNENKKSYVVGAVKEPRFITFRENIRVLDAILSAGGFDEYARENDVSVIRRDVKKIRVKVEDLVKGKDLSQNIELMPGDYVVISEGIF